MSDILSTKMSNSKKTNIKANSADPVDVAIEQWHRERPDLDPTPMGILARVGRIEAMKRRSQEEIFAEHGLNQGLFDVLAALRRSGPPYSLTPSQLATTVMLTTGGMTGRLDKLEAVGWVRREPDPKDRRMLRIRLTRVGYALVDKVIEDHFANEDRILSGLSLSQREQLAEALSACELSIAAAVEHNPDYQDTKHQTIQEKTERKGDDKRSARSYGSNN